MVLIQPNRSTNVVNILGNVKYQHSDGIVATSMDVHAFAPIPFAVSWITVDSRTLLLSKLKYKSIILREIKMLMYIHSTSF